jgi:hypothetical protein
LSNDAVIRFISRSCVPVALNLYEIRKAKGAAGDFFRGVQKQRPAQYQGLYLVHPDGKVLASHQNFKSDKTWPQEVLADLQPGLKAFGEVKPRQFRRADPLPQRGAGVHRDGSVRLGVFLRFIYKGARLEELPNPTLDSLLLTAGEWQALAPPRFEVGRAWVVPEEVGRKFCRILGPGDEDTMPRPHEVQSVHFVGKVKSVADGVAYLAFEGPIAGAHNTQSNKGLCHGDAKLTGVGRYDVKAGRMLALTLVFDGVFRGAGAYNQPAKYGGVVEWRQR